MGGEDINKILSKGLYRNMGTEEIESFLANNELNFRFHNSNVAGVYHAQNNANGDNFEVDHSDVSDIISDVRFPREEYTETFSVPDLDICTDTSEEALKLALLYKTVGNLEYMAVVFSKEGIKNLEVTANAFYNDLVSSKKIDEAKSSLLISHFEDLELLGILYSNVNGYEDITTDEDGLLLKKPCTVVDSEIQPSIKYHSIAEYAADVKFSSLGNIGTPNSLIMSCLDLDSEVARKMNNYLGLSEQDDPFEPTGGNYEDNLSTSVMEKYG